MKQMPEERKILKNFKRGVLSKSGFLGDDSRHLHDIIDTDQKLLDQLGLDRIEIADQLQKLIEKGNAAMEGPVQSGDWIIKARWDRGMGPCPFGEPGLYPKIEVSAVHRLTNQQFKFTQLSVHMIRKHGFFGGIGSAYRLEPAMLASSDILM
jgi:hypothetical protein